MQPTARVPWGLSLRRRAIPAAVGGAVLFFAACSLPNVGLFDGDVLGDIPLYQTYGEAVLDRRVPYRDFFVEYPPGALPALVAPAAASDDLAPVPAVTATEVVSRGFLKRIFGGR